MPTRKTIVAFKMSPDDGFFFRWTSPERALESYRPVVRSVRVAGAEYPLAEPTVQLATFPRVDHGPDAHQGLVLGYAILPLPEASHEEFARTKEMPAEYALAFLGPRGESAREGIDFEVFRRTPATAMFVAEVPV